MVKRTTPSDTADRDDNAETQSGKVVDDDAKVQEFESSAYQGKLYVYTRDSNTFDGYDWDAC